MTQAKPTGFVIAKHLDMAVAFDAQSTALEAQRRAVGARFYASDSLTPGSPYVAGSRRSNAGGNLHGARESEFEVGMPLWLPGQQDAYRDTVTTGVVEMEERLALRRLEVAALLRDAWWRAQRAVRDAAIAQNRFATARSIESDMNRREQLGEGPHQDALLARNETLAAEAEVVQTEAAVKATRAAYALLTGGATPNGILEPVAKGVAMDDHPALRASTATLVRAEAQARHIAASFIDNPEIGVFGRHEKSTEYEFGKNPADLSRTDSTTIGFRFKVPLPTPGRNEPRRAEAESEVIKAYADRERSLRYVRAEVAATRIAIAAAQRSEKIAVTRLNAANDHFNLTRKAFELGEVSVVDLYRVRQLQLDAERAQANAVIDVGVAQSRLNQAQGYAPGL